MSSAIRPVHDELLIVFAREPVAGQVKTRLASATNNLFALQVYTRLLARTLRLANSVCRETPTQSARSLMIAFDNNGTEVANRPSPAFLSDAAQSAGAWLWPQPQADLGERMLQAFDAGFSAGAQRVVLIGCDAPTMTWRTLSDAFSALQTRRMCIAPTIDGGYCLIGTNQRRPELFKRMRWSHPTVFNETIRRARGESWLTLDRQHDIDELSDWLHWCDQRKARGLAESLDRVAAEAT